MEQFKGMARTTHQAENLDEKEKEGGPRMLLMATTRQQRRTYGLTTTGEGEARPRANGLHGDDERREGSISKDRAEEE